MKQGSLRTAALLGFLSLSLIADSEAQKAPAPRRSPQKKTEQRPTSSTNPLDALLAEAEKAIEQKNLAGAVEVLQRYLAERPADAIAQFHLGYAYSGLERWEDAQAAYTRAIELDPKLAAAHLNLGLVLLELQLYSSAVAPLVKAVELLPEQGQPRFLLGTALERSGKQAEAIEHYQTASRLDARKFDPHFALARVLLAAGRVVEAEREFRAALELRRDSAPARLGLAESLIAQGKAEAASAELETYLRMQPQDQASRIQLASLYVDMGRYAPALAELDRVAATEAPAATLTAGNRLRAEIFLRQRRFPEAVEVFENLLKTEPGNAELHGRLGRLRLELRDFPAAERTLLEAVRLKPELIDPLRDLVAVYYLGENYPAALAAMDRLAQRETPSAGSWFVRATCYDKLGQKAEALEAYQKFLAEDQGRSENQDFQARQRVRILTRELKKK